MTKNITVLDESGNVIGQTFPKRAKGLIKKGRARYKDEHTLCLVACPPNESNSEEHNMNNIDNKSINDSVNVNVGVGVNVSVDPETGEVLDLPSKDAVQPETVSVKLLRYANGMENWHGEVQILLAPQYENGKNVVPVYSTEVEYTLTIVDCYDKEKTIRLRPSTVYAEGVSRGLAFVRFTPCVAAGDNRWIPEQNKSYWVRFSAIGTDGKLYVSENEREIILKAPPMLNGRWITTGLEASPSQGGRPPIPKGGSSASKNEDLESRIEDLQSQIVDLGCQIEDLTSQIEDLEDQIDDFEDQISDFEDENKELKESMSEHSKRSECPDTKRAKGIDNQSVWKLLELERSITNQQSEAIAALVKPTSAEENSAYAQVLSSITASFEEQRQKIREQYKVILQDNQ